jgi:hypothetical protein
VFTGVHAHGTSLDGQLNPYHVIVRYYKQRDYEGSSQATGCQRAESGRTLLTYLLTYSMERNPS